MVFRKQSVLKLAALLLATLGVVTVAYVLFLRADQTDAPYEPSSNTTRSTSKTEQKGAVTPVINLQPTVDAWAAQQSASGGGTASVVVIDLTNNKTVAELNPDRPYFTASIYKLYVAYEGYLKVADGTYSLNDPYLTGYTRGKCLDAMIRDSYSPCGEKMWVELGKENITARLKSYGLQNTSMTALRTTARDAAIVLQRLFERRELTEAHTNLFLDSLKTQDAKYRRGLPSGFSRSNVYNKVGWNELVEWHDTAIVTLPSGRSYVVTVLTENIGSSNIVSLGKLIEAKLSES